MAIIAAITKHTGYPKKYNAEEDMNNYLYVRILQEDMTVLELEILCEDKAEAIKMGRDWTDAEWDAWFNSTDKPEIE